MRLAQLPEIKMARKIIKRHSLKIPFDLDSLVRKYATVIYKSIPVDGVDGVCLYLKTLAFAYVLHLQITLRNVFLR